MGTLEEEGKKRRKEEEENGRRGEEEIRQGDVTEEPLSTLNPDVYPQRRTQPSARKWRGFVLALVVVGLLVGLPPLLTWQRTGEQRAKSLSNMRRLADAWQLYAQDWDGAPVPTVEQRTEAKNTAATWLTWNRRLGAYGGTAAVLDNPANPAGERSHALQDPERKFAVTTSYALNTRFWDTFAPGPFPVDNLELPAQTALFVEAGPMSADPLRSPKTEAESRSLARLEYSDVADRVEGLYPYPATHSGKLAVVAADGHAVSLSVEHYAPASGPHNARYGRIGGDIYNWNGGHTNGDVDHPPVE